MEGLLQATVFWTWIGVDHTLPPPAEGFVVDLVEAREMSVWRSTESEIIKQGRAFVPSNTKSIIDSVVPAPGTGHHSASSMD